MRGNSLSINRKFITRFFPTVQDSELMIYYICERGKEIMENVFDTARYILEQCGSMSTMKLQKLCYYARAWTLVWDDAPLFEEDFQAWANGLVCPNCFLRHRVSTL